MEQKEAAEAASFVGRVSYFEMVDMAPRVVAVPLAVSVVNPWPLAVRPGPVPGAPGELLTVLLAVPELALLAAGLVLGTGERGDEDESGCVALAVAAAVSAALRPTCLSSTGSGFASRASARAAAFFCFLRFA